MAATLPYTRPLHKNIAQSLLWICPGATTAAASRHTGRMPEDHVAAATLQVGAEDEELSSRLTKELTAFNIAATGADDQRDLSVRVTDDKGELVAGLSGWSWGGCGGINLVWVRADARHQGWGSRLLEAAEAEARARGCSRMVVSSITFQAPGFYERHGYVDTGRTEGLPGGHADVHFLKVIDEQAYAAVRKQAQTP